MSSQCAPTPPLAHRARAKRTGLRTHVGFEKFSLQPWLMILYSQVIQIQFIVSRNADTMIPEISSDNIRLSYMQIYVQMY